MRGGEGGGEGDLHARRDGVVGEAGKLFPLVVEVGAERVVEHVALLQLVTQAAVTSVLLLHPVQHFLHSTNGQRTPQASPPSGTLNSQAPTGSMVE